MATLAKDLLQQVGVLLQDRALERWGSLEMLAWLNEGVSLVCTSKRNVNTEQVSVALSPGTRQSLPDNTLRVVSFVRNDTPSNKEAVQLADRSFLDRMSPNWQAVEQSPVVKDVCYKRVDLKSFYVSPPNDGNGILLVDLVLLPNDMTSLGDTIPVPDEYNPHLVNYVLGRALQSETEEQARARGDALHRMFMQSLGIVDKVQEMTDPNTEEDGGGESQ